MLRPIAALSIASLSACQGMTTKGLYPKECTEFGTEDVRNQDWSGIAVLDEEGSFYDYSKWASEDMIVHVPENVPLAQEVELGRLVQDVAAEWKTVLDDNNGPEINVLIGEDSPYHGTFSCEALNYEIDGDNISYRVAPNEVVVCVVNQTYVDENMTGTGFEGRDIWGTASSSSEYCYESLRYGLIRLNPDALQTDEGYQWNLVAHELGHVFGLRHVEFIEDENHLMAPAPDGDVTVESVLDEIESHHEAIECLFTEDYGKQESCYESQSPYEEEHSDTLEE